jgi:hypothetical protein
MLAIQMFLSDQTGPESRKPPAPHAPPQPTALTDMILKLGAGSGNLPSVENDANIA